MNQPPGAEAIHPIPRAQNGLEALERGAARRRAPFRSAAASGPSPQPVPQNGESEEGKLSTPSDAPSRLASAALPVRNSVQSASQVFLENELSQLRQTLAVLQAEQARDHEALRHLAAGWTRLSRENAEWPKQAEDFQARLESVEERVEQTTLVLPLKPSNPHGPRVRPRMFARPTGRLRRRFALTRKLQSRIVDQFGVSSSSGTLRHGRITILSLTGVAAILLGITFRLFSG
jgi:hypothetical protein